jgi:hypothetical protein
VLAVSSIRKLRHNSISNFKPSFRQNCQGTQNTILKQVVDDHHDIMDMDDQTDNSVHDGEKSGPGSNIVIGEEYSRTGPSQQENRFLRNGYEHYYTPAGTMGMQWNPKAEPRRF